MTINPCCIPLKTGVRMVTHLTMALSLAVGWSSLKLISISSEVSSDTSTDVIKTSGGIGGEIGVGNDNVFIPSSEQHPPPQSFYNAHIFESHQVPPQYRIPYEYILYHKWHQQQQMRQQQHTGGGGGGGDGYPSGQHHYQQQRPFYDDNFAAWYYHQQQLQQNQHPLFPSQLERDDGNGFPSFSTALPLPPPPHPAPPPQVKPQPYDSRSQQQERNDDGNKNSSTNSENVDEDEQHKIFRSVLHQRKNFKGVAPVLSSSPSSSSPSSSSPSGDLTSRQVMWRNSSEKVGDDRGRVGAAGATIPLQISTSSQLVRKEDEKRERGQVSKDRSSSNPPFFPLEDEKETTEKGDRSGSSSPKTQVFARHRQQQQQQQRKQRDSEEEGDAHEMMNRPRSMMMMMSSSKLSRENSQRDGVGYQDGGIRGRSGNGSTSSKKLLPDFKGQYAKTLLICGLLSFCTVVFQFLTSFLLLCFVDKGSNAAAQIWTAVHCSVIFCLSTCLVLFLCEGMSMPKYIFDETLYLSLVTIDSLLSIYFLWVVMAFI